MGPSNSPRTWSAPKWHPDLGDATVQLEHLRGFSLLLQSTVPGATARLETPEPGLMDVNVELLNGTVAEVHSVPCAEFPEKRRLAIFFWPGSKDEKEVYAQSIESAVTCFVGGGTS
jgi:hypothetical protein